MNSLTSLTEYEHGMQHVECHDYENESEQYADDVMNTSEWLLNYRMPLMMIGCDCLQVCSCMLKIIMIQNISVIK